MYLDEATFATAIRAVPIACIDLLVRNPHGSWLVGYRRNHPAKGTWFVPGGRIRKDETMPAAFARLTNAELGRAVSLDAAHWHGLYEHHYAENFTGATDFSTHNLVLAFRLDWPSDHLDLQGQHDGHRWLSRGALLSDDTVNAYTKDYFRPTPRGFGVVQP